MSEQGGLTPTILEEGQTEPESAPENGILKSESLDEEEKLELQRRLAAQNQERRKSKSGAGKGKLTRSLAVCEESSARSGGESHQDQESIHLQLSSFPSLQEEDKSRKDDSEREKEKDKNREKLSERPKIRMLSKDCSQEYTDSTGIDLHGFLINTLKNNSRDRMILLKMEQEMIDFIADSNNHYKKFPQMSSYQRMLVHRVAAYFGLDHNVDQTGKSVIINKTSSTRIPEQRFCEHLKDEKSEESQKRFILKRDNSSIDKEDNQSVCSQESLFLDNRAHRDSSGRTSGSRQSSSETELRWPDHQRAWSSTDSDSSNRNLKPTMTKTASFGGITVLTRGDSTSSTRSAGKLSKTGSESSSSAGSSGSLSRTHPQSTALTSSVAAGSPGCMAYSENGMGGQVPPSSTSYILLPLESATGIPPGSILLNPHTGQPFVNPDGTPAIYNPPGSQQTLRGTVGGQPQQPPQQQPSPQPQQQVQASQPQMAGPLVTQSVQSLQPSSQSVQYPAVSFPPQHLLPMSPTQHFPLREELAAQFSQLSMSRQSSGDTPEPPSGTVYPASLLPQTAQPQSYVITSAGQQLSTGGFSDSGPPISQQVLQAPPSPQGFVQQPPPAQMSVYYYPSGQYPTSTSQQYRPLASVQYSAQRSQQIPQTTQQAGYQPVLSGQQGFQGMMGVQQSAHSQGVMSSQQGAPVHGVMVSYPTMSSYQVPMTQGSQAVPQQTYQPPIMLPSQAGQGSLPATGMPVYCNVTPPNPQNNLRLMGPHCPSSTVPVMSASCRTNCGNVSNAGWQVKF
ncbi:cAMP-regulated phosphoprotein 21 isoform X11 [Mus musculus]|uniref:Isoform 4 of cAMP-regulated phosphoprotein 21 n=1 Tax=Mus musculus TaxID=10090 RepID=Q9DCB4-4|nr:cAMP-regulated phosphoprotein 21 isoform 4 [Mus musculus]NP_001348945.1 cAMP-regulated phosphoprotein 21 isoform 4 [Mus musculus]NP_001348946.1 cAMP-regulated phosphoprotein 21 isoform 4 [Mus musculus]NP_001348947.1 cAMP-regulated phosphoprotein 21 isoform 4 [Mus musculus]XP_006512413.1 cAMP-regulated phosphoprotein 21 isoform X11 [Mus musculus]XP_030100530.1 cAMP-regulated phosphoprotein 21 isoform X11 [Mus musculus]EDL08963.1 cyclic AMP-regulated phosphoprotein, 21, isoform CRA_c [Mus mu|eukprot:NP_001171087.1 cAMP-regulated phosphoprotein 21 isoform 4 [Mus musculus]